jgi:hypothetical protein
VAGEFRVNAHAAGVQSGGQVAALADGGFVVTWAAPTQNSGFPGVYAQRYDAGGATVGAEFHVTDVFSSSQRAPSIAGLANGGFVIGWNDVNNGINRSILRRFDADGTGRAEVLNGAFSSDVRFAALSDGGYVAFWAVSNSGTVMQRYSAANTALGGATLVTSTWTGNRITAASLADGGVIVAWDDYSSHDIVARRYGADGSAVGGVQTIDTSSDHAEQPQVAALADGGYVVVWRSETATADYNVMGQQFAADGSRVGVEIVLSVETAGPQTNVHVSGLDAGGFVVVWTSDERLTANPADPDGLGVHARIFSTGGTSLVGGPGDDTFVVTQAGLAATTTIDGLGGHDVITTADTALDLSAITLTGIEAITTTNAVGTHFVGSAGDDYVIGAGRYDTMAYSGVHLDYAITGDLASTSVTGAEGHDILATVEQQDFLDGRLIHDVESAAAMIYRYYAVGLDRAPDALGLNNWLQVLETRHSPTEIANAFVSSQEFIDKYAGLDNTGFVTAFYNNAFDRAPDTAGLNYWVNYLNNGGNRGYLFMGFVNSAEASEQTRAAVEAGIWALDFDAGIVARMFDAAFEHGPNRTEFEHYMARLDDGASYSAIAAELAATSAFVTAYGGLSDGAFVDELYLNALHRPADAAGKQSWIDQMSLGMSRSDVFLNIANSVEHQILYAPNLEHGVMLDFVH